MIRNNLESKELRELWKIKDEAYQEVSDCRNVKDMVSKRIRICKTRASRIKRRFKTTR